MKILVVGAGGVGSAFASIAVRRSYFESLTLTDLDVARAQRTVDRLGDPRLTAAVIDASSSDEVEAAIRTAGADAVLNAADPRFVMPIFDACFSAGVTYLDMAMSLSRPHATNPHSEVGVKLGDDQFARAREWEERGLLALAGMGVEPGLADV